MSTRRVVVVGSINVDLVVHVDHLPVPGETVLGGRFERHLGGKGANQAVAAARAGAEVTLIGAIGADTDGDASLEGLRSEGIDVSRVRRVDAPTGVATIAVEPHGQNQIAVAPGANVALSIEDVAMIDGEVVLTSLEVPMSVAVAAVAAAGKRGSLAILNPAPAKPLPASVLEHRPILTPNQLELPVAMGVADRGAALGLLLAQGLTALVTLGERGVEVVADGQVLPIPALAGIRAVDSTGAGDTFNGVLAAWLAAGEGLLAAARAANAAAGLSVTVPGARQGMPGAAAIRHALETSRVSGA